MASQMTTIRLSTFAIVGLCASIVAGCSIKQLTVDLIADGFAGSNDAFATDDDPELVLDAIPFGLKTYEMMLDASPKNRTLLLAAARGYTAYAYLLQDIAERIEEPHLLRSRELRARARKLYLRGRDYALRGLEIAHPQFRRLLREDASVTLAATTLDDVGFLYWAGAAWAGALSAAKDDAGLIADLPVSGLLVRRVVELDEAYELGAAHEFLVSYEASRPGGSTQAARQHYRRAIELSGGVKASTFLALAESVCIREQALAEFRILLASAQAIDPERDLSIRLLNTIARRRAAWLEQRIPDLFIEEADRRKTS